MAKAAFQPIRKENLSGEVAAQVRKEILRGTYRPGERLPSERELALAFGVNRTTVREALQKLQSLGLVSIRQGSGVEVLDYRKTGRLDLLVHLLTTPDAEGRYDARAFVSALEAIQALYKDAIELAVKRMSAAESAELERLLERQLQITNLDEFIANDARIHRKVFAATKNVALQLLFNTFEEIYETYSSPFRIFFEKDLEHGGHSAVRSYYALALEHLRARDLDKLNELIDEIFKPRDPKLFEELMKQYTF